MKWSAAIKCPASVNYLPTSAKQDELVVTELSRAKMASRPLKKAKYAYQGKRRNENGISNYQLGRAMTKSSSDDSSEAETIDPIRTLGATTATADHTQQHSPSSSSINGTSENNQNIISSQHQGIASTSRSSTVCTLSSMSSVNSDVGQINLCNYDCNANKNNASNQINVALCRWQSRQLAQGIIDNAINRVLGDLGIPSNPNETIMNPTFGEPISWGSYLNAQNIENEGVVEAIRQQGLHHKRFVQNQLDSQHQNLTKIDNNVCEKSEDATRRSLFSDNASSTSSASIGTSVNLLEDNDPINKQKKPPPSTYYSAGVTTCDKEQQDVSSGLQSHEIIQDPDVLLKPEDLLSTAVSYAISEKGLGVLNVNE